MREHYNNLNRIQAQDNKSKSQTEIENNYFLKNLYNQSIILRLKIGALRILVYKYMAII